MDKYVLNGTISRIRMRNSCLIPSSFVQAALGFAQRFGSFSRRHELLLVQGSSGEKKLVILEGTEITGDVQQTGQYVVTVSTEMFLLDCFWWLASFFGTILQIRTATFTRESYPWPVTSINKDMIPTAVENGPFAPVATSAKMSSLVIGRGIRCRRPQMACSANNISPVY